MRFPAPPLAAACRRRWALLLLCALAATARPENRFPRPQFESGYVEPSTAEPLPAAAARDVLDVVALAAALAAASWLALRRRSRRGLLLLSAVSLAYFGFARRGCVCPVGSLQNVALAAAGRGDVVPLTVLAFFLLPLGFALFCGRVFCAAVCPLGAVQELAIWRPLRLPRWLAQTLELAPPLVLGAAVLYAAAGARFPVCRYDPFVGFFRLSGPPAMLAAGAALLLLGVWIARPYCRFFCPYGWLLGLASRLSWRHTTITPDECIDCRLCEGACPVEAIRFPAAREDGAARRRSLRAAGAALLLLLPAMAAGAWLGARLGPAFAGTQPFIRVAREIADEARGRGPARTPEAGWLKETGASAGETLAAADREERRFIRGGALYGAWVGGVVLLTLGGLFARRDPPQHEPDRGTCVSCGRCFRYCPVAAKPDAVALRVRDPEGGSRP